MKKTLYHGSEFKIEKPLFGAGNVANDYGLGFYCTEQLELAYEWAVDDLRDGFANVYELETDGLDILDLNGTEYCELHWLAVLLENRTFDMVSPLAAEARDYLLTNFLPNYQERDVIVGYRADDSYFAYAQDFITGGISLRQLSNAMKLGKLGLQFVVKSERAFGRLQYVESLPASAKDWFKSKDERDSAARYAYLHSERHKRQKGDLYVTAILDEEMRPGDARLQ